MLRPSLVLFLLLPCLLAQDPALPPTRTHAFVPNEGQWATAASFVLPTPGAAASLDATGIDVALACRVPDAAAQHATNQPGGYGIVGPLVHDQLRLAFVGSAGVPPTAGERAPGVTHVYHGAPDTWRTGLPTFHSVHWQGAWPGVDVLAEAPPDAAFAFTLHCGAGVDPRVAMLQWQGLQAITRRDDGSLVLRSAAGELLQSAPIAWQIAADGSTLPRPVVTVLDGTTFRFRVDARHPDLPTVVDPVLTLLVGVDDCSCGVARDANGRLYTAGFGTLPGGRELRLDGIDPTTNPPTILWTTLFGGSGDDLAFDVDAGSNGILTAVGWTNSTNLPTVGAVQPAYGGGAFDGLVASFTSTGLMFQASYLGGSGDDWCCRVALRGANATATIAGATTSSQFLPNPTRPFGGLTDAFVVQQTVGVPTLSYATFLGGAGHDCRLWGNWPTLHPMNMRQLGLDVDAAGRILVSGFTNSSNFPAVFPAVVAPWVAHQTFFAGSWDAFAVIVDPGAPALQQFPWWTYLGANTSDSAIAARFLPNGDVVLAGDTAGAAYAATPGALQTTPGNTVNNDATVTWLDPTPAAGASVRYYSTRLGGTDTDGVFALAVDARGFATVGGYAGPGMLGTGWPADASGWQLAFSAVQDAWLARVRPDGLGRHDLTFGTYLGGTGVEACLDFERADQGSVAIAAATTSPLLPGSGLPPITGAQNGFAGLVEVLPVGVTRNPAGAAAACTEPPSLELDRQPTAGANFELLVGGAPANAIGVILFGAGLPSVPVLGANLCVALPAVAALATSNTNGAAVQSVAVPAGITFPVGLTVQALWLDALCAPGLELVSSAALHL